MFCLHFFIYYFKSVHFIALNMPIGLVFQIDPSKFMYASNYIQCHAPSAVACVGYASSSDSAHLGGENRQYGEGSLSITELTENLLKLARQLENKELHKC